MPFVQARLPCRPQQGVQPGAHRLPNRCPSAVLPVPSWALPTAHVQTQRRRSKDDKFLTLLRHWHALLLVSAQASFDTLQMGSSKEDSRTVTLQVCDSSSGLNTDLLPAAGKQRQEKADGKDVARRQSDFNECAVLQNKGDECKGRS